MSESIFSLYLRFEFDLFIIVYTFYLYAVCLKGVYFGFFGYANDSTKNKLSWDYYDEEEEHLEELNRSTRSVVNALERMLQEFGNFHDNLALWNQINIIMLLFMFTYSSAYIIDVDTNTFVLNEIIMVIFFLLIH